MMPFGMSMGAGNHLFQQHYGNGALQRSQQHQHTRSLRTLTTAAAAATAGAAGVHLYRTGKLPLLPQRGQVASPAQPLVQIPRELAEVICGAIGEIVQVAVLYPLDTIKVRCQAGGLPVRAVLQQLAGPSSSPTTIIRQLYAGVVSASLASVAVGSLYFFTFCAAKRAATKMVAKAEETAKAATPAAAAAAAGAAGLTVVTSTPAGSSSSTGSAASTPRQFPHGTGFDYHGFDPVFAAICSDDKAAAAAAASQLQQQGSPQPASTTAAGNVNSSSSSSPPELSSNGKLQANVLAACAAAVVGALVEAPVELFKHRAQAGQITGAMMPHVVAALRQHGPAALYGSFFIPFLFKSLPYDIGELMTYSSLNDWRAAAQKARATPAAAATPGGQSQPTSVVGTTPASVPAPALDMELEQLQLQHHQQQQQAQSKGVPALASLTAASLSSSSSSAGGLSSLSEAVSNMPDHMWDMAVGATAGAAAVLISMPPDCIKTVMETGGGVQAASGGGPLRSAVAFAGTGRQLMKQHGPGGLFMGVTPRLIESVPSTMLYWLAVEGCRRALEPYVAPEAGPTSAKPTNSSG